MPRTRLILPQADSACGKIFFPDRRTADGHRVALEVWNRATGRVREGYRLAAYRCKRCGGYHVGQRPVDRLPAPTGHRAPDVPDREEPRSDAREYETPRVRRMALYDPAWS